MGRYILVIGEEGTGKSRAIKNLKPQETVIISPNTKELPFRGAANMYKHGRNLRFTNSLPDVGKLIDEINKVPGIKNIIIEDLTHYTSHRIVKERKVQSFDKWTELAADIKLHIIDKAPFTRPDLNVVLIGHTDSVTDAAGIKSIGLLTPGKLLDSKVKIPSHFTYLMHTIVDIDPATNLPRYRFLTNRDGLRLAKSPEGCLDMYIENDLNFVIESIKSYQLAENKRPLGLILNPTDSQEGLKELTPEQMVQEEKSLEVN